MVHTEPQRHSEKKSPCGHPVPGDPDPSGFQGKKYKTVGGMRPIIASLNSGKKTWPRDSAALCDAVLLLPAPSDPVALSLSVPSTPGRPRDVLSQVDQGMMSGARCRHSRLPWRMEASRGDPIG